jgi:hypothetical protein
MQALVGGMKAGLPTLALVIALLREKWVGLQKDEPVAQTTNKTV